MEEEKINTAIDNNASDNSGSNKKVKLLIVVGGVILALIIVGVSMFLLKEKRAKEEIAYSQKIKEKAINYINKNVLGEKATAEITNISKDRDLYKIKLKIQANEYDSYISKDGSLLFPQVVDLNASTTPEEKPDAKAGENTNEKSTIGDFKVTKNEVCQENGKPIIYFFGSTGCPHCVWEKPVVEKVLNNFKDLVSFHKNIDSQKDMDVFLKYSEGGIPALVLGCKYYRVGSGEQSGEENETKNLTALICKLTNNQPSAICEPVKDLGGE
ncbi:thioredoxin family protein [Candidatus Kuenenbacteria bacterium]|nr:thioredoxin family protein [Candidatus Kuenenbacteria bacterium]